MPAIVVIDGEPFADGHGLSRDSFYEQLPDMPSPPTTAAPASGSFSRLCEELLTSGAEQVFSIHIASELSGMFNAARVGAESFGDQVRVIDSGQLSMGLGFQALAAEKAGQAGQNITGMTQAAYSISQRSRVVAMLDSLEFLRRSGRVSNLRAAVGAALRMRAFMEIAGGQVIPLDRIRTRKKALRHLAKELQGQNPVERWAMLHTHAEVQAREFVDMYADGLPDPEYINVTTVIGTHVGPNALGFAAVRSNIRPA